jgi:yeast amino acid transporter
MEKIAYHDKLDTPSSQKGDVAIEAQAVNAFQLNVGGRGATQRRLRNYQVTMIGFCAGIGTGLFVGTG